MSKLTALRHQGSLEKQGKLKTWTWKKYWFTLQDDHLVYLKEEGKGGSRKRTSSSQGEINMNEAQSVKECHGVNHGFPFQIITRSRTHILSAETKTSREEWLEALQQAMLVKSRKSTLLSGDRESSISEVGGSDDGAYESVMGSTMTSASEPFPAKPPLTMSQSEMEREPRCNSTYIDGDGTYDSVFDALEDKHMDSTKESDDEDDNYAEVVNAIRPGDAGSTKETGKLEEEEKEELSGAQDKSESRSNSYSYVQMRTKTAKDYMKKGEGSMVDDYSDVYGNSMDQAEAGGNEEDSGNDSVMAAASQEEKEVASGDSKESYAKVIPKALRQTKDLEQLEKGAADSEEDYDDVEVYIRNSSYSSDTNNNSGSADIQDLPNPRLELITNSAFDEIRHFLALNRGPIEVFKTPPSEDLGGKAVEKLRQMLLDLDGDYDVVLRQKDQAQATRIIESTHL